MTTELTTAFSTAITTIKGDVVDLLTTALPAALAIAGITIALRIGISFFRSIAH